MTSIMHNVVSEVLQCIKILNLKQEELERLLCRESVMNKKECSVKTFCLDAFLELDEALSSLASHLITAPLTGRMFIPLPPAYVTQEEKDKSLSQQLKLAF